MQPEDRHSRFARSRFVAALIVLFSFSFQTYVIQTHIHAASFENSIPSQANHPSSPANKDNPDDCPICQAYAATGLFVAPALIVLALAFAFVDASPFTVLQRETGPLFTRNWQSRAPPHR